MRHSNVVAQLIVTSLLIAANVHGVFLVETEDADESCDFESGFCRGWHNMPSPPDDFDWTVQRGPTSTADTGPSYDHTRGRGGGGQYAHIETSKREPDHMATLSTPFIRWRDDRQHICFQFWYHMFGQSIGRLAAAVVQEDVEPELFVSVEGEHGDQWMQATAEFRRSEMGDQPFKVHFMAWRGQGYYGDIAIDDVTIKHEPCMKIVCGEGEYACASQLQCISADYRCDGIPDCQQGKDDELNCTMETCRDDEFTCPSWGDYGGDYDFNLPVPVCLPHVLRCNGFRDCPSGEDEHNCAMECEADKYTCASGSGCIEPEMVCDGLWDCVDGDDEANCSAADPAPEEYDLFGNWREINETGTSAPSPNTTPQEDRTSSLLATAESHRAGNATTDAESSTASQTIAEAEQTTDLELTSLATAHDTSAAVMNTFQAGGLATETTTKRLTTDTTTTTKHPTTAASIAPTHEAVTKTLPPPLESTLAIETAPERSETIESSTRIQPAFESTTPAEDVPFPATTAQPTLESITSEATSAIDSTSNAKVLTTQTADVHLEVSSSTIDKLRRVATSAAEQATSESFTTTSPAAEDAEAATAGAAHNRAESAATQRGGAVGSRVGALSQVVVGAVAAVFVCRVAR